ncbi:MAG: bifunctional 4-hydroxy-3-methylbut-2-enyl diphosphate reductase/30S ribosomal protein S1 [Acetobacter sp.]|nr:bifunctional 4-hydroxy-3-methylbut-2-enyl diphosphate reductase/30S ribosomal protein S1 [Bacteroides sp.]MCM1340611.1 bifunctional 4-hydroxy-3-methylbut-2-enyl diphosphate reductase/30S ribosomal protein S1 [Acetobacter sp.]MCM1433723.1 bifunctional 4-hydroxy-3-methylbut-2-enyl diphosphate reductase/30S ribosomal protein S1 [Clostridiales bacterium]
MIKLAETAGFCFGVDRAVNLVYDLVEKGEKVCTLGPIIHNSQLVADLESKGVKIIDDISQCPDGYTVIIRTHGVEKSVIDCADDMKIHYVNATCPFVLKIHKIVSEQEKNTITLIAGDENHPEVLGIRSYCRGDSFVFKNENELKNILESNDFSGQNLLICVSQTTFSLKEWKKCEEIIKKLYTNCRIYSTICNATADRQQEAADLSKEVDAMLVIGGRHSSNTCKLRDVCDANADTFLIETADELKNIDLSKYKSVGVTAGASTPSLIIKEVLKTMSEEIIEKEVEAADVVAETAETAEEAAEAAVKASADGEATFEEMLEESFREDENSKVVKGTVVNITPTEVFVDVEGRKQTGVIAFDDLSSEPINNPEDVVAIGDVLDLVIMKTDDNEGVLKLSKKLVDQYKGWEDIVAAKESDEVLEGTVTAVIKGGVIVIAKGVRVFVPASLTGVPRGQELDILKGTTVRFRIIDLKPGRRSAVGSIKVVANEERKAQQEALWATLEEGKKLTGVVKALKDYGAFVDIGGMDGMIHISELSWNRIKHPSEVVNVGDAVEVTIKKLDEENKKISLGFKKLEDNPWEIFKRDYPVGTVCKAKIDGTAAFGAFAEILPGIKGLIHISQISWERIKTPADVLNVGDEVDVKITDVDYDNRRISLSIKELLEKPEETIPELAEETAEDAE